MNGDNEMMVVEDIHDDEEEDTLPHKLSYIIYIITIIYIWWLLL